MSIPCLCEAPGEAGSCVVLPAHTWLPQGRPHPVIRPTLGLPGDEGPGAEKVVGARPRPHSEGRAGAGGAGRPRGPPLCRWINGSEDAWLPETDPVTSRCCSPSEAILFAPGLPGLPHHPYSSS